MPQGHLLSSRSQLSKSLSQHSTGAACAVAAKGAKIQGRKGTCPVYDNHGDEVIDDNKYNDDEDHLPVTNASCSKSAVEAERDVFIDARQQNLLRSIAKSS
jgi:hypothetical protein